MSISRPRLLLPAVALGVSFGIIFPLHAEAEAKPEQIARDHALRADALYQKDDIDGAVTEYREAIQLNPNYTYAHSRLGNALIYKAQYEEAIAECRKAIQLKPAYPDAHNILAHVLLISKQADAAQAECREALRLNPKFAEAHDMMGRILRKRKKQPPQCWNTKQPSD